MNLARRYWCYVTLTVLVTCTSFGCVWIAKQMAMGIAKTAVEKDVELRVGYLPDFWNCFTRPGGGCPSVVAASSPLDSICNRMPTVLVGALRNAQGPTRLALTSLGYGPSGPDLGSLARSVLECETHEQFLDLYNDLLAQGAITTAGAVNAPPINLDISLPDVDAYFDALARASSSDAFEVLLAQVQVVTRNNLQIAQKPEVQAYTRSLEFIVAYTKAYFRNGRFFKAELDLSTLKAQIKASLKERFSLQDSDELDDLVDKLFEEFKKGQGVDAGVAGSEFVFSNLGDVGFVTRAGAKYQFPAIEAKLDPTANNPLTVTKLEPVAIGNDLIRVLFEAIFDAHFQLPCVSNATGKNLALLVNDPEKATSPDSRFLSAEDFQSVESWTNRVESATSALVGRLVRGGGWIALNNEALAQLVETIVGVVVRKVTEKVAWCAYSCKGGQGLTIQGIAAEMRFVTVRVRVIGPPPSYDAEPWG